MASSDGTVFSLDADILALMVNETKSKDITELFQKIKEGYTQQ
jgi:hypothetical protein